MPAPSTQRRALFLILILVVVGAFFYYRERNRPPVASPTTEKQLLHVILESVSGTVSVIHDGATTTASVGQVLETGDTVQTGDDGAASINFFASDRTALDKNSRVKIDEASIDGVNWRIQKVRLTLFAGRAWSRALKLLDLDSTYQVGYNGIVANVRGTAFLVTGKPEFYTLDEFDGVVGMSGAATGTISDSLSLSFDPHYPPEDIARSVYFTPDHVRNDHWLRAQLRADADFAKRASAIRRAHGSDDQPGTIGEEAGPFTLDQPNAPHTFRGVAITEPQNRRVLKPGERIALTATAMLEQGRLVIQKNVTTLATWRVTNPLVATISQDGVLHAAENASGIVGVIARWNDGTHEHSDSQVFTVR